MKKMEDEKFLHIIDKETAKILGMVTYFTGQPCKRGHVSERYTKSQHCLACLDLTSSRWKEENYERVKERAREWNEDNREHIRERSRKWREDNPKRIKETSEKYRRENVERNNERSRNWYKNNKERRREIGKIWVANNKDKVNAYIQNWRERNKCCPEYRANVFARSVVYKCLKITGGEKDGSTFEMLGYTSEDLKNSIESKFSEGMTWANYPEWHIDHLIPINYLTKNGVLDIKEINSLDNLIPMWAEHNISKSDRLLSEWLDEKGSGSEEARLYSRFL